MGPRLTRAGYPRSMKLSKCATSALARDKKEGLLDDDSDHEDVVAERVEEKREDVAPAGGE